MQWKKEQKIYQGLQQWNTVRYRSKKNLHFRESLFFQRKNQNNPLLQHDIVKAERQGCS